MKKALRISVLFVLMISLTILLGQGTSRADITLFQDNFNAENGGVGALNYNFANWNVTDGTVDLIGNGFYDFYPGNGLYVDLDGSTNDAGILATKTSFTFLKNTKYRLDFDLGGNARNYSNDEITLSVSFANAFWNLSSNDPLKPYSVTFISGLSDYTTPIIFSNAGGDNVGAILDNVKLSQVQVPEPATLLLLGLGLVGLAGVKRKFDK